jgi:hypothetical protein
MFAFKKRLPERSGSLFILQYAIAVNDVTLFTNDVTVSSD